MNDIKIYIKIALIFFASIVSTNILTASDISDKNISNEKIIEKSKISFEEQVYDFGKIYVGESVKHAFKFKNLGKGELIINNVKSSCGCTAALVSKNILHKEEEGEIEVKFNSGHYVGKVTKSVVVNSNDPENTKYKLTITGEIIEEVSVNPKRINFGIIRRGGACTKNVEIKTVPELKIDVKIEKIEADPSNLNYMISELNNISAKKIDVKLGKDITIGKITGSLKIYTNSTIQPVINIPVNGEIKG